MEITAYAEPPAAPPTGWPVIGQLIDALSRRDFTGLAACLHDDVRLRAVLPRAVLDLCSAGEVAARFEQWFGGTDGFEVVDASAGMIGPRQYLRWRIRMWPSERPDQSRLVEQHVFTCGADHVESLDLLCSGFHAEHTQRATRSDGGDAR